MGYCRNLVQMFVVFFWDNLYNILVRVVLLSGSIGK